MTQIESTEAMAVANSLLPTVVEVTAVYTLSPTQLIAYCIVTNDPGPNIEIQYPYEPGNQIGITPAIEAWIVEHNVPINPDLPPGWGVVDPSTLALSAFQIRSILIDQEIYDEDVLAAIAAVVAKPMRNRLRTYWVYQTNMARADAQISEIFALPEFNKDSVWLDQLFIDGQAY